MQSRGHSSDFDFQRVCDLVVGQVEVVTEKQHVALALRELTDRLTGNQPFGQTRVVAEPVVVEHGFLGLPSVMRRIDDTTCDPRFKRPTTGEAGSISDRAREALMKGVTRTLGVASSGKRKAKERVSATAVDDFDR